MELKETFVSRQEIFHGRIVDLLADDAPTVELTGTLELAPYEVRYLLRA